MINKAKLHLYVLILVLVVSGTLSSSMLTTGHGWGDDFAQYIMQAKSIVNGTENQFLEQNTFTIQHSSYVLGPVAYPWGYPIILAPVYWVFNLNPLALKIPNVLFFILFLICLFALFKERVSTWDAILVVGLIATQPLMLGYQNLIMSDILFLLFSTFSILLIDRLIRQKNCKPASYIELAALGAVIFWSFYIRINGALLLATLLGCQIIMFVQRIKGGIKPGREIIQFLLPHVVFLAMWILSGLLLPGGETSYSLSLNSIKLGTVFQENRYYYFTQLQTFLVGLPYQRGVTIILGIIGLVGVIARVKKDYVLILYSILTIILLLVWPNQDFRFVFPILPFYVYFAFQGMKAAISRLKNYYLMAGMALIYLFWIALVAVFLSKSIGLAASNLSADRYQAGPFDSVSTELFNFIKAETPADSVILFIKPRAMHLFTDRNSIMVSNCDQLSLGNYAVFRWGDHFDQFPVENIKSCNIDVQQVFSNSIFLVYQIKK